MVFSSSTQCGVATVTGRNGCRSSRSNTVTRTIGGCTARVVSLCLLLFDVLGELAESLKGVCKQPPSDLFVSMSSYRLPFPPLLRGLFLSTCGHFEAWGADPALKGNAQFYVRLIMETESLLDPNSIYSGKLCSR